MSKANGRNLTRTTQHKIILSRVRKLRRQVTEWAEESVALEYDYHAIQYLHNLMDLTEDIVQEVENFEDMGQLPL